MFRPEPMPYASVERPPPSIRALWQTCQLVRKDTRHRDDFVRLNTFRFRSIDTMGAFFERASAHTRGLLISVHLDVVVTVPTFGVPTFKHYQPDLDNIASWRQRLMLPCLREMTVNTQGFEKMRRPEGASWMQTPEAERDVSYDTLVKRVVTVLPVLPNDIWLQIVGTMPDHKLGGLDQVRRSLRKKNMVHFKLVYRGRGYAGWLEESIEELAPPDLRLKELDTLTSGEFGRLCRLVVRRREREAAKRWSTLK